MREKSEREWERVRMRDRVREREREKSEREWERVIRRDRERV